MSFGASVTYEIQIAIYEIQKIGRYYFSKNGVWTKMKYSTTAGNLTFLYQEKGT